MARTGRLKKNARSNANCRRGQCENRSEKGLKIGSASISNASDAVLESEGVATRLNMFAFHSTFSLYVVKCFMIFLVTLIHVTLNKRLKSHDVLMVPS